MISVFYAIPIAPTLSGAQDEFGTPATEVQAHDHSAPNAQPTEVSVYYSTALP